MLVTLVPACVEYRSEGGKELNIPGNKDFANMRGEAFFHRSTAFLLNSHALLLLPPLNQNLAEGDICTPVGYTETPTSRGRLWDMQR